MNKRRYRFRDLRAQEISDGLPADWTTTTLGDACVVIQGQSPPGTTYNVEEIGLPFLQGKAEFGVMYPNAVKWCSAPSKIAEPDDVLISIRAPVGPTNLCAVHSCIGRGLAAIRSQGDIPSKYILYAMRATEKELRAKSTGTTFEAIRGDNLRSHSLPLPPLPEQHRIVAEIEKHFTRLDAALAALKRAQANLKRYRAGVLKAACAGKLVPTEAELARAEGRDYEPAGRLLERILTERRARWQSQDKRRRKYKEPAAPDTSNLPDLPEGWIWATVAQLGTIGEQPVLTGPFGTNLRKQDFTSKGIPVLTIGCLTDAGINVDRAAFVSRKKATELSRYELREGDFLFSRMATVGRAGVVGPEIAGCIFNYHIMRLRLDERSILPQFYIAHVRGSSEVRRYVHEVNHGATRDGINTAQLLEMPVTVPPLAEQLRIVAEVERRLSVIQQAEAAVESSLKRAGRLRQSILKLAFSGRLVSQDPNDEPASVLLERIRAQRAAAPAAAKRRPRRRVPAPSPSGRGPGHGQEQTPSPSGRGLG